MVTTEFIAAHEIAVRLVASFSVFVLMASWEFAAPRRLLRLSKSRRWANNLGLIALNNLIVRFLFPTAAVGVSLVAQEHGWGFFALLELPLALSVVLSVLLLDLVIYGQHVAMHYYAILWRLHRMHHADLDIDVTTGLRFHPIEILVSLLIKCTAIVLLGAPVVAVVLFEIILNATSLFNHGNVRLPLAVDRKVRWFLVTPDMHRVHHSIEADETNSNFGFNLPWWDRIFGTYCDQPRAGHEAMTIGITTFRDERLCNHLIGMLTIPFVGKVSEYAGRIRRSN